MPEPRRTHFVEVALGKIVGAIVYRNEINGDPELGTEVNDMFLAALELLIPHCVEKDDEDGLLTMFKMLNADLRFYSDQTDPGGVVKKYWTVSQKEIDPLTFVDAVKGDPISPFFLRLANHFCQIGGFEAFRKRLEKTEPRPSLPIVRMMLKIMLKMSPWIKNTTLQSEISKLKDPCLEQLSYYTENRPSDQGQLYDGTSDVAIDLLSLNFTEADLEMEFLEFQLKGAIGNINSNVLEKKLHGVKYVNLLVKRGQKWIEKENTGRIARFANWLRMEGEEEEGPTDPRAPKPKPIKPLNPKKVVTWLSENKVSLVLLSLYFFFKVSFLGFGQTFRT